MARQVVAVGDTAQAVSSELVERLRDRDLRVAFVFADWQLDAETLARQVHAGLAPAPVIGGTSIGVLASRQPPGSNRSQFAAVALGLYGDWLRVGVGVARELSSAGLHRSRDAVHEALRGLRRTTDTLELERHVGITVFDGKCGHEESFCIGSAVTAPQIRFVGGAVATEMASDRRAFVWVDGHAVADAGVVVLLESELPFHAVTSAHLVPTAVRVVVTAVSAGGRVIDELDGRPAARRLHELVASLGERLDHSRPSEYSFARYVDHNPYVRSMTRVDHTGIHLASGVEPGHVLRVMRPGDLIGTTTRDLATAATRVGGTMSAFLAFSCIGRHWEAAARGITDQLEAAYAMYPTIGSWSFGEQSGMLLVNHTLTGLAIGSHQRRAMTHRGGESS